jgi:hypothetical protein
VVVEKAELDAIRNISQTIDSQYSPYNNGTDVHNWMEIKAGVKALSKLIPTSNNVEMAKAVEYDSKFEGGARVLVELPSNPNDIVEPKLVDGNVVNKTLDTAFDFVDDVEEQETITINEETIPVKKEEPVETKIETIKEEELPVEQDNFEWELPTEKKPLSTIQDDEADDDIRFDFPDNDEDDDEIPSTLF